MPAFWQSERRIVLLYLVRVRVNTTSQPKFTTQNLNSSCAMTGTNDLTVMDQLKAILVGLGIPEDTIAPDTLIHAHLGLDSVETVKLSLELKHQFDLDLKLGTRKDLTVAEICQMVVAPLPARSA
jgi:acyl carrier protein